MVSSQQHKLNSAFCSLQNIPRSMGECYYRLDFGHFTVNLEHLSTPIKLLQMPILPLHTDLALSK